MKYLILLFLLAACNCAGADIHPTGMAARIRAMAEASVELADQSADGTWDTRCTGVWIAPDAILTAAHCVREDPDLAEVMKLLGLPMPRHTAHYRTWSDALLSAPGVRDAIVEKIDEKHDLALLRVDNAPAHDFARIAFEDPTAGDPVHVMGHTVGMRWSYSPGTVGAIRETTNPGGDAVRVIQVVSGAHRGNSGGGLFNARGELVGICSFLAVDTTLTFFAHRADVVAFVQ